MWGGWIQVCFSSLLHTFTRAYSHSHTAILHRFTYILPLSFHLHTPHTKKTHTETHSQTYTCHAGLHSTSNTATDRHTHSLTSHRGRWGGGVNREIQPILKMLSWCTLTSTHTHGDSQTDKRRSAHMSTHPNEVEQRAQRQHVEAPVRTPWWEERSEVCQKTHYLQSTFRLPQHVRVEWSQVG